MLAGLKCGHDQVSVRTAGGADGHGVDVRTGQGLRDGAVRPGLVAPGKVLGTLQLDIDNDTDLGAWKVGDRLGVHVSDDPGADDGELHLLLQQLLAQR